LALVPAGCSALLWISSFRVKVSGFSRAVYTSPVGCSSALSLYPVRVIFLSSPSMGWIDEVVKG